MLLVLNYDFNDCQLVEIEYKLQFESHPLIEQVPGNSFRNVFISARAIEVTSLLLDVRYILKHTPPFTLHDKVLSDGYWDIEIVKSCIDHTKAKIIFPMKSQWLILVSIEFGLSWII